MGSTSNMAMRAASTQWTDYHKALTCFRPLINQNCSYGSTTKTDQPFLFFLTIFRPDNHPLQQFTSFLLTCNHVGDSLFGGSGGRPLPQEDGVTKFSFEKIKFDANIICFL